MNVSTKTCASSNALVDWPDIEWAKCNQQIKRLQARIVKATQEGRWGKVKVLQWLLTHSFSGRAIAVKRVTENKGKRTSGVDRKLWSTPMAKSRAVRRFSFESTTRFGICYGDGLNAATPTNRIIGLRGSISNPRDFGMGCLWRYQGQPNRIKNQNG